MINRKCIQEALLSYFDTFNMEDERILLKKIHTQKTAEICENIGIEKKLSQEDIDICWLLGMLHDVGRFEQVRDYNTFNDEKSEDHALLGIKTLFGSGLINELGIEHLVDYELLKVVIQEHNKYEVNQELNYRTKMFCNILRDADKIDILRVVNEKPMSDILNISANELYNSDVSLEVLECFYEKKVVSKQIRLTPADNVIAYISYIFGIKYKESLELLMKQTYVYDLFNISFKSSTQSIFDKLKNFVCATII